MPPLRLFPPDDDQLGLADEPQADGFLSEPLGKDIPGVSPKPNTVGRGVLDNDIQKDEFIVVDYAAMRAAKTPEDVIGSLRKNFDTAMDQLLSMQRSNKKAD